MSKEAIEKVEAASKKNSSPELDRIAPDKEQFDAMIQQNQMPDKVAQEQQAAKPSLLQEVAAETDPKLKVSEKKLQDQLRTTIERMDQAKESLTSAGDQVKLKKSYVRPLRNHLTHIDDSIKIAQSTAGIEGKELKQSSGVHPLARFFGTLDHQQNEMEGLSKHLQKMATDGNSLPAEALLHIQMKTGQIQANLEFFTNLLNKALEFTKTMMNIQV